eukprot:9378122-Heterocapsa_arctica.AAC.1
MCGCSWPIRGGAPPLSWCTSRPNRRWAILLEPDSTVDSKEGKLRGSRRYLCCRLEGWVSWSAGWHRLAASLLS